LIGNIFKIYSRLNFSNYLRDKGGTYLETDHDVCAEYNLINPNGKKKTGGRSLFLSFGQVGGQIWAGKNIFDWI
jgi:hypothetical protein